jgi:hypothetical protein
VFSCSGPEPGQEPHRDCHLWEPAFPVAGVDFQVNHAICCFDELIRSGRWEGQEEDRWPNVTHGPRKRDNISIPTYEDHGPRSSRWCGVERVDRELTVYPLLLARVLSRSANVTEDNLGKWNLPRLAELRMPVLLLLRWRLRVEGVVEEGSAVLGQVHLVA